MSFPAARPGPALPGGGRQPGSGRAPGGWPSWWRHVLVGVFVYGTAVHLGQLALARGNPYPECPGWLAVLFVSLTLVDPAVAAALAGRRRGAVWAALAVLAGDAAANGYAGYVLDDAAGFTWSRAGQGVICLLAVVTAVAVRPLERSFAGTPRVSPRTSRSPR